jgi:hypothetical protein
MPYIKPEDRKKLDPSIDALVEKLAVNHFNEGEVNYAFSRVLKAAFLKESRYATINKIMGVLECVKSEFYRRHAAPYEDLKIKENGDI